MSHVATTAPDLAAPPRLPTFGRRIGRLVRAQPLGVLGGVLTASFIFLALFGPLLAPFDPNDQTSDVLQRPGSAHWFGTDEFGRDYFSRMLAGARISIGVALVAVTLGLTVGTALGMTSAYAGGWFDMAVQRVVDTLLSLPTLVKAMFFVAVFGASAGNLIFVLAIAITPGVSRVARGSTFAVMHVPYMDAARVLGASHVRLLLRHVLPNIAAPLLVILSTSIGALVLAQASLSFIGLGIKPPTPDWGGMLALSRKRSLLAPWLAIFPGAAISLAVLGVNLLGDALRDTWDPRLHVR